MNNTLITCLKSHRATAAVFLVLLQTVGCGLQTTTLPEATSIAPVACEDLLSSFLPKVNITSAKAIGAGKLPSTVAGGRVPMDWSMLPAFCRVTGSIQPTDTSDIRFELWLPKTGWNGRFMQTGNGGAAGAIQRHSLVEPLLRGYAVANTDTGHQGGSGDFSWAAGEPEKVTDYAYRAVHELTVVGKALTASRYGKVPEKSYWLGCSTGGRQGLMEAQRYPDDYDAIIAGAPAANWLALQSQSLIMHANLDVGGLPVEKLGLLHESAIAACDALDGVEDRVINASEQCPFDPATLLCQSAPSDNCLTKQELAAAQNIYETKRQADGQIKLAGMNPGSEREWAALQPGNGFDIGSSFFRYVVANDPQWDFRTYDIDRDYARFSHASRPLSAIDPDLSSFFNRGGKLIMYHGTTDGLIPYRLSHEYTNNVLATIDPAMIAENFRFFPVPGMNHCSGGEGAFKIDWLSAMERWFEHSESPDTLLGERPGSTTDSSVPARFTRAICAYPQTARYNGSGNTGDAANYSCALPE